MFDGMMYWQTVQLFTKYNKWRGFWRPEVFGTSCSYWTHYKTFLPYAHAFSLIPLFSCFWFGKNTISHTNNATGTRVLRVCSLLYSRHSVSETFCDIICSFCGQPFLPNEMAIQGPSEHILFQTDQSIGKFIFLSSIFWGFFIFVCVFKLCLKLAYVTRKWLHNEHFTVNEPFNIN